jgi:hypothetical protein
MVGDHPFVLEVRVIRSSDGLVTALRASRAAREVELLLAGLMQSSIHSLSGSSHWVVLQPVEQQNVAYLREHYSAPTIGAQSETFLEAVAPALIVPRNVLFAPYGSLAGQDLAIPDSLSESLARYEGLPPATRDSFLRACYWLQHARGVFPNSFSAAFMSAVTVAETLFENLPGTCSTCGQRRFGLGASFADWLESHVPAEVIPLSSAEACCFHRRLKQLYARRSVLTHGSDLLRRDKAGIGVHMTPRQNLENQDVRTLLDVMHLALGNWLVREPAAVVTGERPALFERALRWCAARAGNAHTWLLRWAENLSHRRPTGSK